MEETSSASVEEDDGDPLFDQSGEHPIVVPGDSVEQTLGLDAEHGRHLHLGVLRVVVRAGEYQGVAIRGEDVACAARDPCLIQIRHVGDDHPDDESPSGAEGTSNGVRPVTQPSGHVADPTLGVLSDPARGRPVIENTGDGGDVHSRLSGDITQRGLGRPGLAIRHGGERTQAGFTTHLAHTGRLFPSLGALPEEEARSGASRGHVRIPTRRSLRPDGARRRDAGHALRRRSLCRPFRPERQGHLDPRHLGSDDAAGDPAVGCAPGITHPQGAGGRRPPAGQPRAIPE